MLSLLYSLTAFAAATSAIAATAEVTPAAATKPKPHGHGREPSTSPSLTALVTDDQDKGTLAQARWLPRIHKYLVDEGVYYENFFAPVRNSQPPQLSQYAPRGGPRPPPTRWIELTLSQVSVCCPSRVSLLRAQYAHNHNITFVSPPWGGWDVFHKYGYVQHTLPDFLQEAGYNTYYTGKFM
jgi:N-acetylglucosamine-6-sulfatase